MVRPTHYIVIYSILTPSLEAARHLLTITCGGEDLLYLFNTSTEASTLPHWIGVLQFEKACLEHQVL